MCVCVCVCVFNSQAFHPLQLPCMTDTVLLQPILQGEDCLLITIIPLTVELQ